MAQVIPLFKVFMSDTVKDLVSETLYSGYITQGPKVEQFESLFESHFGFPIATVNSCTSAITLALRLANIKVGDEVITTPMTCQATNVPILAHGAIPVWADVYPRTGLIHPDSVLSKITNKTRAIICVDWGGTPCDYDRLMDIADERDIKLIADAAHSLGSTYKYQPVGTLAHYTCFSFQAIKHLTTGDGGAIACKDPEELKRAKILRWFGIDRNSGPKDFRGEIDVRNWGYKFHMNDINASIGIGNLPEVAAKIISAYAANGEYYRTHLSSRFDNTRPDYIHASSSWIHTILLPPRERDAFKQWAEKRGVQVSQVHWRNDNLTVFRPFYRGFLTGLDEFSQMMLCIPSHWGVDASQVCELNEWWR